MVYIMVMKVDGGCRHNGYSNAIGAAAVIVEQRWGRSKTYTYRLSSPPRPTSQRAELLAIVRALELAQEKADELDDSPYMEVTIFTDSKYAHGCMTDWSFKWRNNGWINAAGNDVANRDLIEQAVELQEAFERNGDVKYKWVPRAQNQEADEAVNEELDDMENEDEDEYPSSSDDE